MAPKKIPGKQNLYVFKNGAIARKLKNGKFKIVGHVKNQKGGFFPILPALAGLGSAVGIASQIKDLFRK